MTDKNYMETLNAYAETTAKIIDGAQTLRPDTVGSRHMLIDILQDELNDLRKAWHVEKPKSRRNTDEFGVILFVSHLLRDLAKQLETGISTESEKAATLLKIVQRTTQLTAYWNNSLRREG